MDSVLHLLIKFFVVTQFLQATDCQFMESGSGSGVLVTTDIPTNHTSQGSIRLVGGIYDDFDGRVEVFYNGSWGVVCDFDFSYSDAVVACRQLGLAYDRYQTPQPFSVYYDDDENVILYDLNCTGTETSLFNCPRSDYIVYGGRYAIHLFCIDPEMFKCFSSYDWNPPNGIGVLNSTGYGDVAVFSCNPGFNMIGLSTGFCFGRALIKYLPKCIPNLIGHCRHGDIRLVGGSTRYAGLLEVCSNNAWGSVCDNNFGYNDAKVACRQLGFSDRGADYKCCGGFGQGSGEIVFESLHCLGSESSLFHCPRANSTCSHSNDVGLSCQALTFEESFMICPKATGVNIHRTTSPTGVIRVGFTKWYYCDSSETLKGSSHCTCLPGGVWSGRPPTCTSNSIRLVGGSTRLEGQIQVFLNGYWRNICDDGFSSVEATVACRQLGFSGLGAVAKSCSLCGQSTGTFNFGFKDLECNGTEASLFQCTHSGVYDPGDCGQVGVICKDPLQVACPQLIQPSNGSVVVESTQLGGIALYSCSTGFSRIGLTARVCLENSTWSGAEPICIPTGRFCLTGDIRLVDGSGYNGRLEICDDNYWRTVCDDSLSSNASQVACRRLGFSDQGVESHCCAKFGQGFGSILFLGRRDFRCNSFETSLLNCRISFNRYPSRQCFHNEDVGISCKAISVSEAGVTCSGLLPPAHGSVFLTGLGIGHIAKYSCLSGYTLQGFTYSTCLVGGVWSGQQPSCMRTESLRNIRLVEGATELEGRIEVLYRGQWAVVCGDGFESKEAAVACRQLGFSGSVDVVPCCASFGQGSGRIVLKKLACDGTEASLLQCLHFDYLFCDHGRDAGVICRAAVTDSSKLIVGVTVGPVIVALMILLVCGCLLAVIVRRYRQRKPQTQTDQPHPVKNQESGDVGLELKNHSCDNDVDLPLANMTSDHGGDCTEICAESELENPPPTFQDPTDSVNIKNGTSFTPALTDDPKQ